MLNVTIQNDGKIKFQLECSSTKEIKCDLVLTWVDQNRKLLAVKELKENIDLWLKDAKGYIDSYCAGKKVVLLTGDEDEVEKAAKKFESSECLRVCISKH